MFLQSEEFIRAYKEEVASFSRFAHANIMHLLDAQDDNESGRQSRIAHLLFPLMRGSLRDQLNATVLQPGWSQVPASVSRRRLQRTLQQFLDICCAFQVLHMHTPLAYVHQDVKPDNILVNLCSSGSGSGSGRYSDRDIESGSSAGQTDPGPMLQYTGLYGTDIDTGMDWAQSIPLLTDFGSVRPAEVFIANRSVSLTVADEAASMCTVSYRAPELFDPPNGATLDTRTDVWGLGCLLFAMHFGYSPYESDFSVSSGAIRVTDCSYSRCV